MTETLSQKRYTGREKKIDRSWPRVFVCANCQGISDTSRSHTITCSNACRVALHRHPERLAYWQEWADLSEVTIQQQLDVAAAMLLLFDADTASIENGSLKVSDLRENIFKAYWGLATAREGLKP